MSPPSHPHYRHDHSQLHDPVRQGGLKVRMVTLRRSGIQMGMCIHSLVAYRLPFPGALLSQLPPLSASSLPVPPSCIVVRPLLVRTGDGLVRIWQRIVAAQSLRQNLRDDAAACDETLKRE